MFVFVCYALIVSYLYRKVNREYKQFYKLVSNWVLTFLYHLCYNGSMNTIKDFMHEKGLTQAELAERLGYSQPHVANVINGKSKVNDKFRWRWQEAFGAKALKVLNGDDDAS